MIVGEIVYQELPTASRRNWLDLHGICMRQQPPTNLEKNRPTMGKWDKCGSIVYEPCLRQLHQTLINQPPLWPELVGEGAKVSGVPM
jgi:hypothetical protein